MRLAYAGSTSQSRPPFADRDVLFLQPHGAADGAAEADARPWPGRRRRSSRPLSATASTAAASANCTYRSVRRPPGRSARRRSGRSRTRRRSASGTAAGRRSEIRRVAVRPSVSSSQNARGSCAAGRDHADAGDRGAPHGAARCVVAAGASPGSASVSTWPRSGRGASGPRWKTTEGRLVAGVAQPVPHADRDEQPSPAASVGLCPSRRSGDRAAGRGRGTPREYGW